MYVWLGFIVHPQNPQKHNILYKKVILYILLSLHVKAMWAYGQNTIKQFGLYPSHHCFAVSLNTKPRKPPI